MKPPIKIPEELYQQYTLNGKIAVGYQYIDNTSFVENHKIFSKSQIDHYIKEIKAKKTFYYGRTDKWLHKAFKQFSIKNLKVAIIGSEIPVYESFVLAYGGIPYTIEYHKIETDDERLNLITVEEYNQNPIIFDAVLSISSIEHNGLGRYGDPIDPLGDISAMRSIKKMLVPGGLCYLAVPVGRDVLMWNAQRIYGKIRLKMLLKNWKVLNTFGYPLLVKILKRYRQPVFVLKPK
jgi:hypothetical protein